MRKLLLLFVLSLPTVTYSQTVEEECTDGSVAPHSQISQLAQNVYSAALFDGQSEFENIYLLSKTGEETPNSVKYTFYPNMILRPRQCAYLSVPQHLQNQSLHSLVLGHKANEEGNRGRNPETNYDTKPALTSVQIGTTTSGNNMSWRFWNGSSSGKYGAKFAEPRYDLEMENIYEWYKNGYTDVANNERGNTPFNPNMMRVCSVGDDPVDLGSLELRTFPGYAKTYMEHNFGSGTQMGDSLTAAGRNYGELAGAITLNGSNNGTVPAGWQHSGDSLSIPLEAGRSVKTFEISLSDTHASSISGHDDNQHTTAGWARLDVGIRKADGRFIPIIQDENVPPRGVIYGVPSESVSLEEGDKLVITANDDRMHVLGLKIGLD